MADLETVAVATFDVVAFGLLAVLAGHAGGALGDFLQGVGTVPGLAAFGYLWALTLLAVRWVLAEGSLAGDGDRSLGGLLARGTAGGAFVGTAFVVGLAAGLVALGTGADLTSVVLIALFGAVGGALVGAVVGVALGVVDVGLARGADAVVDRLAA
ncbi:MAG: hypothetical protein V5A61_10620 [Haloarculaceae archaeon]